jgi:hypothetical protein
MDKYFQSGTLVVCASCHFSCASCSSSSSCLGCNITKGRIKDTSYCKCLSTYYDDLKFEECISCPITCFTCNSFGCLTCNSSNYR